MFNIHTVLPLALTTTALLAISTAAPAQTTAPAATAPGTAPVVTAAAAAAVVTSAVLPPADYMIGPDDVLDIVFWRDKDMSAQVAVRPDGKITLPVLNDIVAVGLTPDQLRERVNEAARKYIADANATVSVKQINSRKVFITGEVEKPGAYPLGTSMTVLQLIAMAGGLREYADGEQIVVMRTEGPVEWAETRTSDANGEHVVVTRGGTGRQLAFRFNYGQVRERKNLRQNIELKPGDTVIVP